MGLVEIHDSHRDGYGYMHRADAIFPATRTDAQKGGTSTDSCHTRPGNPSVEAFACYARAVNPTYITGAEEPTETDSSPKSQPRTMVHYSARLQTLNPS